MTEEVTGRELAQIATAKTIHEFEAILEELEIPPSERRGILRRLGKKTDVKIPDKIDTPWLIKELEAKLALALSYVDEHALSRANIRDLASLVALFVDRRQLLRGEPTQIASIEDRRAMNEIMPLLLREAQRRGVTIDLPTEDYAVIGEQVQVEDKRPKKRLVRD